MVCKNAHVKMSIDLKFLLTEFSVYNSGPSGMLFLDVLWGEGSFSAIQQVLWPRYVIPILGIVSSRAHTLFLVFSIAADKIPHFHN